jgi:vacuolar-type H+-ATPase subunit H
VTEAAPLSGPGVEALVRRVMDVINAARPMPLSTSVMVNRDEIIELLEAALSELPDEVREARWLLKEREELLVKAKIDAGLVIEEARTRVAQMVQRTEVVRSAERKARQMVEQAESQARRRRHEVDDYCEQRLEQFATALEKVQSAVTDARGRLQPTMPVREPEPSIEPEDPSRPEVFDQDET